ncbi:MAG: hypothetical protein JW797_11175 [Bradymonadales bacterium]|nr:hypothetical protein [Bradymonadales bacterium]
MEVAEVHCLASTDCPDPGQQCVGGRCVQTDDGVDTGKDTEEDAQLDIDLPDSQVDGEDQEDQVELCDFQPYCSNDEKTLITCVSGMVVSQDCGSLRCCDDACVDVNSSVAHCGGCGDRCPGAEEGVSSTCVNGNCQSSCLLGRMDMNGDLAEDNSDGCECSLVDPVGDCPHHDCGSGTTEEDRCDLSSRYLYVAPAPLGSSSGDGSAAQPFKTLDAALLAVTEDHNVILVASGIYNLNQKPIQYDGEVEIWIAGGFDPSTDWQRSEEHPSTLAGANPVVEIAGSAPSHWVHLVLLAEDGRDGGQAGESGETSIGMVAVNTDLSLHEVEVIAGDGGLGQHGAAGSSGVEVSVRGQAAQPGLDECICNTSDRCTTGTGNNICPRAGGLGGGSNTCREVPRSHTRGGAGGRGKYGALDAMPGTDGGHPYGGLGGTVGSGVFQNGGVGADGSAGAPGIGGGPFGYVRGNRWHSLPGGTGGEGQPGFGGGGGAGKDHAQDDQVAGASGGGGGSGGCGGVGGQGGGGGGGSIALLLIDTRALLDGGRLESGEGGDGSHGAQGGVSQPGESGQLGGAFVNGLGETERAGSGGDGGDGGDGGHGGGGAAGLSVSLMAVGYQEAIRWLELPDLVHGAAGVGGDGAPDYRLDLDGDGLPDTEVLSSGYIGYAGYFLRYGEAKTESEESGQCPRGMVEDSSGVSIGGLQSQVTYCIDMVEATRPMATSTQAEDSDWSFSGAQAMAGYQVLPWNQVNLVESIIACSRAGKTLCPIGFQQNTCRGGEANHPYPYGSPHQPGLCNDASGGQGSVAVTGGYPLCVSSTGPVFDLTGNLAEWAISILPLMGVDTTETAYGAVGGSYLDDKNDSCCSALEWLSGMNMYVRREDLGFRCCMIAGHLLDQEYGAVIIHDQ